MLSSPRLPLLLGFALTMSGMLPAWAVDLSNLEEAELELEQGAAEWQAIHEKEPSPETATNLAEFFQALGIVERQAGKPDEALEHLTTACDLLSENAPDLLPDALEAKALTIQDLGRLEEAENLLRTVLESRRQAASTPSDPDLSSTLDHLAMNLLYQGRSTEVAPLLDEAIRQAGTSDPELLAQLLGHRGRLHHSLGSHVRAIERYREALALPFQDPELRLSLESQVALAQLRLGRTEEARNGTEAVARTAREIFKTEPLRAVPYINNLGELALSLGQAEEAGTAFEEALQMLESSLGDHHQSLIGPLNNLGVTKQVIGDYDAANRYLERAASLQVEHLPAIHLSVAETERNLARNALLSQSSRAKEHVERATSIGLDLLERLVREGSEKERLNFLERFELLSLPCATGDAELIANVLLSSKARLLDAMLSETPQEHRPSWQELQAALAPGTAFIDTCRYFTIDSPVEELYGAILILPEGSPKWIPLGPADDLKRWLDAFRSRLAWRSASLAGDAGKAPPLKLRGILRALHRNFWKPLADQFPSGIEHIAYSPAGSLHFLPLAALLDSEDHPLSTEYLQIATVSSGRDLIGPEVADEILGSPWTIMTVSSFPKAAPGSGENRLLTLLSALEDMPGTRNEARRIREIAPDGSLFLTDSEATESALQSLPFAPSVLHLGCHAFFLEDPDPVSGLPVDFDERSELLFSGGLVLYRGAERSIDSPRLSDSDDLLFPSEIARLPLGGTRLVTLSSCESGAGTPVSGEGVLGLRRAFSLAGAREVVVALWPVSDQSTPIFMDQFYRRAATSGRPAQALWQTQGDFLADATSDDEFELAVLRYAPFVLSQNTPLITGDSISRPEVSPESSFPGSPWRYLIAALPLILFLIARSTTRQSSDST